MPALSEPVKRFIVQCLACYDSPTTVADLVREQFGIEVSRMQVASYNPRKVAGRKLPLKWESLFEETQKRFNDERDGVPIARKIVRLRALGRLAEKAERAQAIPLALQALEQAAKEAGGIYTPEGNGGKLVVEITGGLPDTPLPDRLSPEQQAAAASEQAQYNAESL
jgi:hypothetical protein